jgi:hypothetical protein
LMDCVKNDMKIKGVSMEMTGDKRKWKKKTCCATPLGTKISLFIYLLGRYTFNYLHYKHLTINIP